MAIIDILNSATESAKGALAGAISTTVLGFSVWLIKRLVNHSTESSSEAIKGRFNLELAAIQAWKEMNDSLITEVEALRLEVDKVNGRVERLQASNNQLRGLYYRAVAYIEFQEAHIHVTEPNWPPHTMPKELQEP